MTSGPAASSSRESDTTGSTPPKSTVGQRNVARSRRHGTMATSTRHGEAAMDDERENLSWQRFGEASRELAKVIADDGFEPDLILSTAPARPFLAASLASPPPL